LLKLNASEWHYGLLGTLGAVIAGCEFPLVAFTIAEVLVAYYDPDVRAMEREVRKYTSIFTGAVLVVVLGHLFQHYFFAAMGETLTTRVREMMFSGTTRYNLQNSNTTCFIMLLLKLRIKSTTSSLFFT
jgi:ATP-binding cassette subfamily B (MDR/TAP) protein 1